MRDIFEDINKNKMAKDSIKYGNSISYIVGRKWYNPFRYLMSENTWKRISPKNLRV